MAEYGAEEGIAATVPFRTMRTPVVERIAGAQSPFSTMSNGQRYVMLCAGLN